MQVRSLDREDPLEEGMATHFLYSCLENPMDRGAAEERPHPLSARRAGPWTTRALPGIRCRSGFCVHPRPKGQL